MTSCQTENEQSTNIAVDSTATKIDSITPPSTKSSEIITTVDLDYGFKLGVGRDEDLETFKTYSLFELSKDAKIVYVDSSMTEYEFRDKLYPIVLKTGKNKHELLFEINDRPNKNYLKRLFIIDNKVVKEDSLPTFISKPVDINNDGLKEYAGFWYDNQIWGENNSLSAYNPILYYTLTDKGIILDSMLTMERNEIIYGEFKGYTFNNKIETKKTLDKFDGEVSLISEKK